VEGRLFKILAEETQNEHHFSPEMTSDLACKRNVGSPSDEWWEVPVKTSQGM